MTAYKLSADEFFYVYSMSRKLRVIAYALTEKDANAFMERHDAAAVVAVFGDLILLADRYDNGEAQ